MIFSRNFSFLIENSNNDIDKPLVVNLTHQYTFDEKSRSLFFSEIEHFRSSFYNGKIVEKNTYSFKDHEDSKNCILAFNGSMLTNIPDIRYSGFTYLTISLDECVAQYKMSFSELRSLREENDFLRKVHADCQKYNLDMQLSSKKPIHQKNKI